MMMEATKQQGKFMDTLELAFASQKFWISHHVANFDVLWRYLPQVGLDMKKLEEDMKNPQLQKMVTQDLSDAKKLGANKTPSYFVNGKPLEIFGLKPLQELIASEVALQYKQSYSTYIKDV